LDDRRRWYRYHHLFAEVLQTHLVDEQPDLAPILHRRASAWYCENGEASDAIRHALAAGTFADAADLIERAAAATLRNRQEATLLRWLKVLPDEVLRDRPVLSDIYAGALLSNGHFDDVDARLRAAEDGLHSPVMVVADEQGFRRLPGTIAAHRAALALARGDLSGAVHHARRAVDLVAEDDHLWRGAASAIMGLAAWTSGDLESAHRTYGEGMLSLQRAGHIADVLGCAITLADIRIAQGRLHDARRTYEQALRLAAEQRPSILRGTADMHVGLSQLDLERDDVEAARQHVFKKPGNGRAQRAAAESVSLAGGDGAHSRGRRRPGRRARVARRSRAAVHH
jgi:LuxR family maltose regulon positive regulatory protein